LAASRIAWLMLFGLKESFAIECEITNKSKPYFFGKVRIWLNGHAFGDFSGEIISTYVIYTEQILDHVANGPYDCSDVLPYMETLRWRITPVERGHRIDASSPQSSDLVVHLGAGELVDTIRSFGDWVRSHPEFAGA